MIKLEVSRRDDQRGFTLRILGVVVLFVHFWRIWRYQKRALHGWSVKVAFGRGAGYKWGRTAFIGWRVRGGPVKYHHNPALFRLGFTRNGNMTPYGFR